MAGLAWLHAWMDVLKFSVQPSSAAGSENEYQVYINIMYVRTAYQLLPASPESSWMRSSNPPPSIKRGLTPAYHPPRRLADHPPPPTILSGRPSRPLPRPVCPAFCNPRCLLSLALCVCSRCLSACVPCNQPDLSPTCPPDPQPAGQQNDSTSESYPLSQAILAGTAANDPLTHSLLSASASASASASSTQGGSRHETASASADPKTKMAVVPALLQRGAPLEPRKKRKPNFHSRPAGGSWDLRDPRKRLVFILILVGSIVFVLFVAGLGYYARRGTSPVSPLSANLR